MNFDKTSLENQTADFSKVRKQELERRWDKAVELYENYVLSYDAQKEDFKY